ncbi:MAG: hypothetical protein AAFQ89_22845 [Cyanobacteria bacterium J06626_18]
MTVQVNDDRQRLTLKKFRTTGISILIGGVLLALIGQLLGFSEILKRTMWYLSPDAQNLVSQAAVGAEASFPNVSGFNLLGDQFYFPSDFTAPYNVVLLVYTQPQQNDVYTWVPLLEQIEADYNDVEYYELPTLPEFNAAARAQLDQWMIAGIPDEATRDRTITLYLDVETFNQAVNIDSTEAIQLLLVTPNGEILWRTEGRFSEAKGEALQTRIDSLVD